MARDCRASRAWPDRKASRVSPEPKVIQVYKVRSVLWVHPGRQDSREVPDQSARSVTLDLLVPKASLEVQDLPAHRAVLVRCFLTCLCVLVFLSFDSVT